MNSYHDYIMEILKEYILEIWCNDETNTKILQESEYLKKIPKTNSQYAYHPENTSKKTKNHVHIYVNNNQIMAINCDGTGHDGSSWKEVPKKIYKFLTTQLGFHIADSRILENNELTNLSIYSKYFIISI